jgi:hypothetical protein
LEVRGLEVECERHLATDVIESETPLRVDLVDVGDLLRRDVSAHEEHRHGGEQHSSDPDGDQDLHEGEGLDNPEDTGTDAAQRRGKGSHYGIRRTTLSC